MDDKFQLMIDGLQAVVGRCCAGGSGVMECNMKDSHGGKRTTWGEERGGVHCQVPGPSCPHHMELGAPNLLL